MLYELDILEARRIAELALEAREVRDRLLEKVKDDDLGEPVPVRGEHNPSRNVVLDSALDNNPAFVTLREAIAGLPRDIRDKLWVVTQIGGGQRAILDWDGTVLEAAALPDHDLLAFMLGEPDLHDSLQKGLYMLGVSKTLSDVD